MTGASLKVVNAMVHADPCPAPVGEIHGCSPLHLAVKFLACTGCQHQERIVLTPAEELERTHRMVHVLEDVMIVMNYPGRKDFKDEDILGYSPLDYAIEGNIKEEEWVRCLLRRKEPKSRSSCPL